MSVLPSYRNSQLTCCANQLTGFNIGATLAFNGLNLMDDALANFMRLLRCLWDNSF